MNLQIIRQKLEQKKGAQNQISSDLEKTQKNINQIEREISYSEKSQAIIQTVAQITQNKLSYHICEPVSLALASVFDDAYKMVANFEITGRGTTECHLFFERDGHLMKPFDAGGGGPIAISSFALRMGSWSLAKPRSRPIIFLDEPFLWLDKKKKKNKGDIIKMHLAGQMLKMFTKPLPEGLGVQIIMSSHIPELIQEADKTFETTINKRVTTIEEI